MKDEKITPDILKTVGNALYGTQWQTDLAKALNLSSTRRLRAWIAGERNIPQAIRGELIELLLQNSKETKEIAKKLKNLTMKLKSDVV